MSGENKSMGSNQITFEIVKAAVTQGFCLKISGQMGHIYYNYSDLLNTLYKEFLVNFLYFIDSFC